MSVYDLSTGNFVLITEKIGVLQNFCLTTLECVTTEDGSLPVKDTGLKIKPNEKFPFKVEDDRQMFIRAEKVRKYLSEQIAVVEQLEHNCNHDCGNICGGDIADDDDIDGIIDGYELAEDDDIDSLFGITTPSTPPADSDYALAEDADIDSLF